MNTHIYILLLVHIIKLCVFIKYRLRCDLTIVYCPDAFIACREEEDKNKQKKEKFHDFYAFD